jgi:membrane-bound lytic murein transglycosylase D
MKKTFYIALAALTLMTGCTTLKRTFGFAPKSTSSTVTSTATIDTVEATLDSTLLTTDTLIEVTQPAIAIPEEWTTIQDDSLVVLESMSGELDSLLNSWYAQTFLMVDTTCTATTTNPVFSDTVYTERLANLPCLVPMVYNQPVRTHIDRYATKLRHQVSYMLGMMEYYEPLIEQALDVHGVPNELKYLPVVESALNPVAVSRVGATGLWQFMYSTGKLYGLKQNSLVDDRRDPVKATWAAAKYLRALYDRFGD